MSELSTGKSIMVCAIVLGCFAVLWPKIFYPMIFGTTYDGSKISSDRFRSDRPSHMNPDMMHPGMRERNPGRPPHHPQDPDMPVRRTIEKELRPGPVPGMRPSMGGPGIQPQVQRQGQGAMGILMPLYTIGIVIFFVYTIMKKDENHGSFKKPTRLSSDYYMNQTSGKERRENDLIEQFLNAKHSEDEVKIVNALSENILRSVVQKQKQNQDFEEDDSESKLEKEEIEKIPVMKDNNNKDSKLKDVQESSLETESNTSEISDEQHEDIHDIDHLNMATHEEIQEVLENFQDDLENDEAETSSGDQQIAMLQERLMATEQQMLEMLAQLQSLKKADSQVQKEALNKETCDREGSHESKDNRVGDTRETS